MEDDRNVLVRELLREVEHVAVVQLDIEDREIGLLLLESEHRIRDACVGPLDFEPGFLNGIAKVERDDHFIFGDQNSVTHAVLPTRTYFSDPGLRV